MRLCHNVPAAAGCGNEDVWHALVECSQVFFHFHTTVHHLLRWYVRFEDVIPMIMGYSNFRGAKLHTGTIGHTITHKSYLQFLTRLELCAQLVVITQYCDAARIWLCKISHVHWICTYIKYKDSSVGLLLASPRLFEFPPPFPSASSLLRLNALTIECRSEWNVSILCVSVCIWRASSRVGLRTRADTLPGGARRASTYMGM